MNVEPEGKRRRVVVGVVAVAVLLVALAVAVTAPKDDSPSLEAPF